MSFICYISHICYLLCLIFLHSLIIEMILVQDANSLPFVFVQPPVTYSVSALNILLTAFQIPSVFCSLYGVIFSHCYCKFFLLITVLYLFQQHNLLTVTEPNSMHMLWLIPQYFVMTLGEVMFSVTGLEFSYSQVMPVVSLLLSV